MCLECQLFSKTRSFLKLTYVTPYRNMKYLNVDVNLHRRQNFNLFFTMEEIDLSLDRKTIIFLQLKAHINSGAPEHIFRTL